MAGFIIWSHIRSENHVTGRTYPTCLRSVPLYAVHVACTCSFDCLALCAHSATCSVRCFLSVCHCPENAILAPRVLLAVWMSFLCRVSILFLLLLISCNLCFPIFGDVIFAVPSFHFHVIIYQKLSFREISPPEVNSSSSKSCMNFSVCFVISRNVGFPVQLMPHATSSK